MPVAQDQQGVAEGRFLPIVGAAVLERARPVVVRPQKVVGQDEVEFQVADTALVGIVVIEFEGLGQRLIPLLGVVGALLPRFVVGGRGGLRGERRRAGERGGQQGIASLAMIFIGFLSISISMSAAGRSRTPT
jgi:hypothetical protein